MTIILYFMICYLNDFRINNIPLTDVDYFVFSDAASFVRQGLSPYLRSVRNQINSIIFALENETKKTFYFSSEHMIQRQFNQNYLINELSVENRGFITQFCIAGIPIVILHFSPGYYFLDTISRYLEKLFSFYSIGHQLV